MENGSRGLSPSQNRPSQSRLPQSSPALFSDNAERLALPKGEGLSTSVGIYLW